MDTYECVTCKRTVEIDSFEASLGIHEHYEHIQCMDCFNKDSEKTAEHSSTICKSCGTKMEAEFVDIGIGEQQVSDWQCPNDSCPEYIEWLEKQASE